MAIKKIKCLVNNPIIFHNLRKINYFKQFGTYFNVFYLQFYNTTYLIYFFLYIFVHNYSIILFVYLPIC